MLKGSQDRLQGSMRQRTPTTHQYPGSGACIIGVDFTSEQVFESSLGRCAASVARLSSGVGQHSIHRRHTDTEAPRDLGSLQPFGIQLDHLSGFGTGCGLAALVFLVALRLCYPFALSLQQKATLEFGYSANTVIISLPVGFRVSIC